MNLDPAEIAESVDLADTIYRAIYDRMPDAETILDAIAGALNTVPVPLPSGFYLVNQETGEPLGTVTMMRSTLRDEVQVLRWNGTWVQIGERYGATMLLVREGAAR